jgi:exoribonuclease-2
VHILYEENGSFKVGSILTDGDTSLQVEALHGKRAKIKARDVLLRFEEPPPGELLMRADALADEIDLDFLWECCQTEEFSFVDLAREYCGKTPSAIEAAGILVKLHSAPMYFYRKGRGRYRAAPADTLRAALAGVERRREQELQIETWTACLMRSEMPEEFRPLLEQLLYMPDRSRRETKALERACERTGLSPAKLIERCGALPSSHDYHLKRFLFEYFPHGTEFPAGLEAEDPQDLPVADAAAFSLDDAGTVEIDDAFSVAPLGSRRVRVGIHIAAPGLGFEPGSAMDAVARARLSTVYMPGRKITMLPEQAIRRFTLEQGGSCPAVSLYLDVDSENFAIENRHTRIERVPIAANLRHQSIAALDDAFLAGEIPADTPYAHELHTLWQIALALEAARGKNSVAQDRSDYAFVVEDDHVTIVERRRGTPLDKLVAELMIAVNSAWGKLLDENGIAAIYRAQGDGKVRMTTSPAAHQGLGTTHYAWCSSPLRRYVDLVNQWQLLALLRGEEPLFARNSDAMLAAIHDFDTTYAGYGEFQDGMERYWCLRWLLQEKVEIAAAQVVRDNLVRFERLPLYTKVPSLPALSVGSRVEVAVSSIDVLDLDLRCEFRGRLES